MSPRGVAAAFDALVMVALAVTTTGGSFASERANVVVWGSAAAAAVAALIVLTDGPAALGWAAVGYILFAGFASDPPGLVLLLLALAYVPMLRRPRGSLAAGIAIAVAAALLIRVLAARLL